ncbi:MAG: YeeE/YedE family protein [Caldilineaceae bacterium]|nr:YeeE/YedE family protein [Caldilineaceae bacterium]MCY4090320.1 YeeE/YedE family protein [Caldilineaceae bacterium]MDE0429107.1 YeeE/YedE family protein [Caldilineaceae bacterium]
MTILLALAAGAVLGYLFERGDFCFHSTLRGLVRRPRQPNLARAYLLSLLIALPLVQGMTALGWISPWIAPWSWQANLVGGLIFGAGMVVAATCVTGIFYKLGHGMLGTLVGLATWSIGDVVTWRGPLNPWREALNRNVVEVEGQTATLVNTLGAPLGPVVVFLLLAAAAFYLWRSPKPSLEEYWSWRTLGLSVGLFTALAWLLARLGESDYTFGTSRVPTALYETLVSGVDPSNLWIPVALVALLPGALIASRRAGTFWARGESTGRYAQLAAGGLLMGVGAGISGGCNLGHSLVGVPLLSLGSITTTLAMLLGVFLADRAIGMLRPMQPKAN